MRRATNYYTRKLVRFVSRSVLVLYAISLFIACEDRIELNVRETNPQLIIIGEISNRQRAHLVTVQRTVPISSSQIAEPVLDAQIRVTDEDGRVYDFNAGDAPGEYHSQIFRGQVGKTYTMEVRVGDQHYTASSTMPKPVPIDSIGIASSTFLDQTKLYVNLKFDDPRDEPNAYRYVSSLNGGTFRFSGIFSDKMNDGLHVSHELMEFERDLTDGDSVRIHRQYVDEASYQFWRSVASSNPTTAAPANPPTNWIGGALGYFSAYSLNEYDVVIPRKVEE